jgi:signal transduction histidine kinase/FixJ family two-component response regulator
VKRISLAIISQDHGLVTVLKNMIQESLDFVRVTYYNSDFSFFEEISKDKTDVILLDQRNSSETWSSFLDELQRYGYDLFSVFYVDDCGSRKIVEMVKAGAYDIITPSSISRILPILQKILKEKNEKEQFRYLTTEKRFGDHIADNSRSMLSIINRDYVYEKVNATFCTAHTIKTEGIVGKSLEEIWGKETFESKIRQNIDLCFQGNIVRYEANFNTPIFGNRFFEVVFRPIKKETGQITHLLAETFDITDLRHSQKVVSDIEEEFKRLETNLPIGFLRCDNKGTIIHANRAFLKIMECEDEALIAGLEIQEFYVEKGLFLIHLSQMLDSEVKTFDRVSLYTCIGNEIVCRLSGFIVTSESGDPAFIDFALEDSSRELMLENRLLQAQKLETIGALAGGLAHDFNNILTTISGYSELILDEIPESSPIVEKVGKIQAALSKARSITDQILTFSRQVDQEKIHVGVSAVLKETIGFVKSGTKGNITFAENIDDGKAIVYADPTQLFRVFLNLFTNAIQAIGEKEGTISIKLEMVSGITVRHEQDKNIVADEYAIVTISDSGEGMEPSVMERIFEPYFTTRETGKGTGLGLSVVHGIIAEIEGFIRVSSKKDQGSVFSVYLPVIEKDDESDKELMKRRNLLFISGNRYESRILSLALEKSGYKILYTSDLNSFIKSVSRDQNLPELIIYMDDSEEIRPDDLINIYSSKKIKTPVILISDRNQLEAAEKIINLGIVKQRLIKPVSLKEIHSAIQLSLN